MKDRGIALEKTEKNCILYPAEEADRPLIVLNHFAEDGGSLVRALRESSCGDGSLLVVGDLDWNRDLSPWAAPAIRKSEEPFSGGADAYLDALLHVILPEAEKRISGKPAFYGIAGYSLAGLFALYSLYRCERFTRAASMSGSLWFPDFLQFATTEPLRVRPEKLYLSLGDREAKTRNPQLAAVQENTEKLCAHYRSLGLNAEFTLNEGNHFRDAELRTAKGIAAIL